MSRLSCAVLAASLSSAALADAQSLADKASSWIDRHPRRLMYSLNQAGLYPSLGNLGEGAGSGPGLAYFAPGFAGTPLDVNLGGAWSFKGDSVVNLRLGRIPYAPGRAPSKRRTLEALMPSMLDGSNARPFFVYGEFRHQELANGRLYGSDGDTAIPFVYKDNSYEAVMGYRLTRRLVASVRAGWLDTHASLDTADAAASFQGGLDASTRGLSFQATTFSLAYDHRDHPRDPRSGTFVEASVSRYNGMGQGAPSFDRYFLDARQYVPLGERHVFALRGYFERADGDVPYYLQHALGGSRTLRSFPQYRFRGPKLASLSAEYRFRVKGPFELAAFYDGGRVWGGASEMATPGFASSYGAGLRIKSRDDVLIRLDAAQGSEGARVNLSFGYSF
jgi:Omp85 superfamily domain